MPNEKSSYDHIPNFGALYDSVPVYVARRDVDFYLQEAGKARGPVLELGCGTGRITLPLARAGHHVVGVDASSVMIERCREHVAAEEPTIRERVTLHQADVRDLNLGATYSLAIAPFRVFQHLTKIDDQLRFLDGVARHLRREGRFVFDVFNPSFAALVAVDGIEREDTPEQQLADGRTFRRAARVARVRWVEQVSEVELIYYVSPSRGAPAQRYVHGFDMRWYLRSELVHLLQRAGFQVPTIYGDFERRPLGDHSPEMIVCAERR